MSELSDLKEFVASSLMPRIWSLEAELEKLKSTLVSETDKRLDAEATLAEMSVDVEAHEFRSLSSSSSSSLM